MQKDENGLLHEICRNSSMGVEAIHEVLKDIYDEEFAYELNIQADKMEQFGRKAGLRLIQNGSEPEEPGVITTAMLKTSIKMKKALQNHCLIFFSLCMINIRFPAGLFCKSFLI